MVQSEEQAVPQAKGLIEKTKNQLTDERIQQNLIDLIERIIVYIPPSLTEPIRGLSIEQLENLGEALLNFDSEEDLRQWLEQHN